jgi:hypothetical protein
MERTPSLENELLLVNETLLPLNSVSIFTFIGSVRRRLGLAGAKAYAGTRPK